MCRVVKINKDELASDVTEMWAVYDRSRDAQYGGTFPFGSIVNISVRLTNKALGVTDGSFRFKVETESAHNTAFDSSNLPESGPVVGDDPDLQDGQWTYDTGFQLTTGDAAGTKIIFNSSDIAPEIARVAELPIFYVPNAYAVGGAVNLQPPTIFSVPVKVIMPVPEESDASRLSIYLYNGKEWVLGCGISGASDIPGWMVPDSRTNGDGRVEFKVHHFSGLQTALLDEGTDGTDGTDGGGGGGDGISPTDEVGSCFMENLIDFNTSLVFGIFLLTIVVIIVGDLSATIKRKKTP